MKFYTFGPSLHRLLRRHLADAAVRRCAVRKLLQKMLLFPLDGRLSWITHVAIGVLMGVVGWLLYLAALVQQAA